MEDRTVPPYFICPISLQIMKDPVTAITGITYDRESIEHWFSTSNSSKNSIFCPLTKHHLTKDSDSFLTPNHTLRRLINSWLAENDSSNHHTAADRVNRPPVPPLSKTHVRKLMQDIATTSDEFRLIKAVNELEAFAVEFDGDNNRDFTAEKMCVGVANVLVDFVIKCFKTGKIVGLEKALKILAKTKKKKKNPDSANWVFFHFLASFEYLIDSLTWVLGLEIENHVIVKSYAIELLEIAIDDAILDHMNMKLEFFKNITEFLKEEISNSALKSALKILIKTCRRGRNRIKIVEAGAIFELIKLEMDKPDQKMITELIFNLLAQLCSSADGRAEFLRHAGGIAMVSKRILRVSPATNDEAINILWVISKRSSARSDVVEEMLRVGGVSKLCMVMQSDCDEHLKGKVREILRMHWNVWNNSPCIAVYLMTRDPR